MVSQKSFFFVASFGEREVIGLIDEGVSGRVPTVREWKGLFSDRRIWKVDGSVVGGKVYYQ